MAKTRKLIFNFVPLNLSNVSIVIEDVKVQALRRIVKSSTNKYHYAYDIVLNDAPFSFTFHDSIYNFENDIMIKSSRDKKHIKNILTDALHCIISEYNTITNISDFEDFCLEFGYNNDSISDLEKYKDSKGQAKLVDFVFKDEEEQIERLTTFFEDY